MIFANGRFYLHSSQKIFVINTKESSDGLLDKIEEIKYENIKSTEKDSSLLNISISPNKKYLVGSYSSKCIVVWDAISYLQLRVVDVPRFPISLSFNKSSEYILVADKTGDVYKYSILQNDEVPVNNNLDKKEKEPEMGHLSMLLDMIVTTDGEYVITSDRDEKIRVSCFPNMYNIKAFCLGHQEFVSRIAQLHSSNKIISGSGDGIIKLWDFSKGICEDTVDVRRETQPDSKIREQLLKSEVPKESIENALYTVTNLTSTYVDGEYLVAVSLLGVPVVQIYKVQSDQTAVNENCEEIHTGVPPIKIVFADNFLIVQNNLLESDDCNPFSMWKKEKCGYVSVSDHVLLRFGHKFASHFKEFPLPNLDVSILFKQKFDNISDYLLRKEERITTKNKASELVENGAKKQKLNDS